MENILKIMDYAGRLTETEIDLDNLESVSMLRIRVLSGDEVLTAHFKDGTTKCWDSSDCRTLNFYDEDYTLYSEYKTKEENEKMLNRFLARSSSYWRQICTSPNLYAES